MYLNLKAGNYGFDIEVISDNTTIKEDVTIGELFSEVNDRGFRGWKYREPNDEITNSTVQLLEDIAYFRHNNIEGTDNLIIELMRKKSETDVINLLRILNKEFGEEQD